MKINLLILIILFFVHCFAAVAEDFPFYVTDDDHAYQEMVGGGRFIKPQKIKEAMQAKDSRPAGLDVEGNWGAVTFGTQASLRFVKSVFATNEPVIAKLIVRNVNNLVGNYSFRPDAARCIVVVDPQGTTLERTDVAKPKAPHMAAANEAVTPSNKYFLTPGTQEKDEIDLKTCFDLSLPGRYTVYARPRVLNPTINKYIEIQSGNAVIIINNSSSAIVDAPGK